MLFHSFEFLLVFLPITWVGYVLLRRHLPLRYGLGWLTAASLLFLGWHEPSFLFLMLAAILANYSCARLLMAARTQRYRQALFWTGIVLNVGYLGYFKYSAWAVGTANHLFDLNQAVPQVVLPLAISFYTFEQITYLVDVYRGRALKATLLEYTLFLSFFPQLIAGPILHHHEILPALRRHQLRISRTQIAVGISMFAIGIFKKVVLADRLDRYFDRGYEVVIGGITPTFFDAWCMMTCAAMHIYMDYSAYADMAVGLGLLFGIRLPLNFYSPFKATTVAEFWRRWNLTLMRFLREHIYVPLGGNRRGFGRQSIAVLVTMILCGLWHGAGWNCVLWGGVVGLILVAELVLRPRWEVLARGAPWFRRVFGRAVVFVCFVLPLTIFMFPDTTIGLSVIASMVGAEGVVLPERTLGWLGPLGAALQGAGVQFKTPLAVYFGVNQLILLAVTLFVVYACPNTHQLFG
ncbi:MAG: MBOAT family O-acyltransferase, partial [Nevskiales bacterium]